jgi:hypothetical protein
MNQEQTRQQPSPPAHGSAGISAADHRLGAERMKTCAHNRPNVCGCYARPTHPASFICFDCPMYEPNASGEGRNPAEKDA